MSKTALVRRVRSQRLTVILVRRRFYARPPGGTLRPINDRATAAALRAGLLVDRQSFEVERQFRTADQLHPRGTHVRILRPRKAR